MTIEQEAEEYYKDTKFGSEVLKQLAFKDFKAGYNSKATQAKILQAQIDVLDEFRRFTDITIKLDKLQKQLKELE